jgi:hypothetical protein
MTVFLKNPAGRFIPASTQTRDDERPAVAGNLHSDAPNRVL